MRNAKRSQRGEIRLELVATGVVAVLAIFAGFNLFDSNEVGYATVVQYPTGTISVKTGPGVFFQGAGKMSVYKTANHTLSYHAVKAEGESDNRIEVRFRDGGTAMVSVDVTIKLPEDQGSLALIHKDWHSFEGLERGLMHSQVNNSLQTTVTKLSAEESYTDKDRFMNMFHDQLVHGLYEYRQTVGGDGKVTFELMTEDKGGAKSVKRQTNPLETYKISVTRVAVNNIDYDEAIDKTLAAKQGAIQAQVTSRANADKAQQEALEAKAQGEKTLAQRMATEQAETAGANEALKRERIYADITKTKAEADAYQKKTAASANNSLDIKLNAWVKANEAWANSTAKPPVVFTNGGGNGKQSAADTLYPLLMMRSLSAELGVSPAPNGKQ